MDPMDIVGKTSDPMDMSPDVVLDEVVLELLQNPDENTYWQVIRQAVSPPPISKEMLDLELDQIAAEINRYRN